MTTTIMARPRPRTTVPNLRQSRRTAPARAGLRETVEDITRDDDQTGPEPDDFSRMLAAINSHRVPRPRVVQLHEADPAAALGAHLLAVVHAQDTAVPTHRRTPRTVAEMRARMATAADTTGGGQ